MRLRQPKRLKSYQTHSHARAPKQEKELAEEIGGRTVKGSGCGQEKGDVRLPGVARVECKTTRNRSYGVSVDTLRKLEDAAMPSGEIPFLEVELDNQGNPTSFVVLPRWAFETLMGEARDL